MNIQENISLAPYTTLHIGGPAKFFVEIESVEELKGALEFAQIQRSDLREGQTFGASLPVFILGGGSNILVSDNGFNGLVIKINIRGRGIIQDVDEVLLKIAAGETLDEIIALAVENGWWGMENLSLIPSTMGALVIQNVGAYGAETAQIVTSVDVFDRIDGTVKKLSAGDCKFRYRASIFNKEDKGRYIVLAVEIRLQKFGQTNINYIDLRRYFSREGISNPSIGQVREAVISIRRTKGFDTDKIWSAGSFFKNVFLDIDKLGLFARMVEDGFGKAKAEELNEVIKKLSPDTSTGSIKIPTAFILDKLLELKGMQIGGAKLSELQVLSIVNTGKATAADVIALFEKVKTLVLEKTGLTLEPEPEFLGF